MCALRISFHNDTVFLARAKTFEEANTKLVEMMEREDGALNWAKSHRSSFEIDKMALIGFTRCRMKSPKHLRKTEVVQCPPIVIQG